MLYVVVFGLQYFICLMNSNSFFNLILRFLLILLYFPHCCFQFLLKLKIKITFVWVSCLYFSSPLSFFSLDNSSWTLYTYIFLFSSSNFNYSISSLFLSFSSFIHSNSSWSCFTKTDCPPGLYLNKLELLERISYTWLTFFCSSPSFKFNFIISASFSFREIYKSSITFFILCMSPFKLSV